ncbi:hypothetical protein [Anabaena subtropica]|uniref:Uncharacterized protein n=1 Tax=Anabaena subtropica FACHB-260 TaxID=2692884 RepID=A0ABR8CQ66_9NOST|nr:hypothetical protein [Anabaena subtropica]MBD2344534.1 hypothetical protein [Anabaena subtropica FACHB-260]
MRYIFFPILLPFLVTGFAGNAFALQYQSVSNNHTLAVESTDENFYTEASRLLQQQLDLIVRIEQALVSPDANRMRAVRGQLNVQTKTVEGFLKRLHRSRHNLCNLTNASPLSDQLSESQTKVYCALSASSQELLKLAPMLDKLLSRRGELGLVRRLPLVSGERNSDPILTIAPVQHPNLGKPATPLSTREPNLAPTNQQASPQFTTVIAPSALPIIGRVGKTAIANYVPPMQPAIAPPDAALNILAKAKQLLTAAQIVFPPETKFRDAQETVTALDRFAYGLDPQEPETYAQFLRLPRTGIFRVLPASAYQRPLNTLSNRLQSRVSDRYSFPTLDNTQGELNPSLTLHLVDDRFQLQHEGVNYSFMVDMGDVPLEKLDNSLKAVPTSTREFFLNYQPPKQLEALQVDRRRFVTGKDQNWQHNQVILASATAKLNHTYLVRSLQFQLPEIILNGQISNLEKSSYINQLNQIRSSDMIIAFRPVRKRSDGSYTILWRVLNELPAPQLED